MGDPRRGKKGGGMYMYDRIVSELSKLVVALNKLSVHYRTTGRRLLPPHRPASSLLLALTTAVPPFPSS